MIDPKSAPAAPQDTPREAHIRNVSDNIAILESSIADAQKARDIINADIAVHRTEIAEWKLMLPRKRRTPKSK